MFSRRSYRSRHSRVDKTALIFRRSRGFFVRIFHQSCGVFCLFLYTVFALPVASAQASAEPELKSADVYQLSDKQKQRRLSNAEYIDVPITARIPQRFEMYSPHSTEALHELKSMGFTQVILDWPNLHSAAVKAGLKVVLANWWIDKSKPQDIEKGIERARKVDPKALIGFSVMDEPGRNSPDTPFGYYIDLYEDLKPKFRSEFPGTRLEISHWGPMANWSEEHYQYFSLLYEAADVMRIMPYPDLHEAPLDDVFFMVHRSRKLMTIAQRELPLVVILQTWVLPPENKLPEIDELRVMAYQAMLAGAETVSFFDYNTDVWKKTAGFEDAFRKLMTELTTFSHRHRNDTATTSIGDDGILTATLFSPSGVRTRVEVNTRREVVGTMRGLQVKTTMQSPAVRDSVLAMPLVVEHCCPPPSQSSNCITPHFSDCCPIRCVPRRRTIRRRLRR